MRKIFMGVVWFLVLWIGSLGAGGGIYASFAKAKAPLPEQMPKNFSESFEHGQQIGYQAGTEFGLRYGGIILVGALAVSILGTITGFLPGTKKKQAASDASSSA